MKLTQLFSILFLVALTLCPFAASADDEGFVSIFNGENLEGWEGNPKFWRVEDGSIVGQTTESNPTDHNTFCFWRDGELDDFELKLEYKIVGGNSGIQYRSEELDDFVAKGYQADFEAGDTYSGINYEEKGRGILANRGQKVEVYDDPKQNKVLETFGDSAEIQSHIKKEDWNDYHIIAKGNHLIHMINGVKTSEVIDKGTEKSRRKGVLALQVHAGPPMQIWVKNIRLKRLPLGDKKKVVFVAGSPSHGYGQHEHNAGCLLLASALEESVGDQILTTVYRDNGYPKDPTAFDNADAIVVYCDGGGGHLLLKHLKEFDKVMKRGVGLACLHYAVEIPKGDPGKAFLDWLGGYFETEWSVNPHWRPSFEEIPKHPVTRGIEPFSIQDEWYYHMRFRQDMDKVTPILMDVPTEETLSRPDGPHSGNPAVRKAVAEKVPQVVAWVCERPDGGRGFGFTGGHFHNNWGNDEFRKLVLNAFVWIAGGEVPEQGVVTETPTQEDLEANQDYPKS
ncbi:MAG: DUF1080 domain-containing protein [Candidatus Omnitrophica bacterium]|nr:DUF1080 domain-containing protein [Candidatus Omnitrophota bacterium]